jgi:hypothetical protein
VSSNINSDYGKEEDSTMTRAIVTIFSCAALICAFALPSIMASDAPAGNVFKGFEWPDGKKAVASFDHANHKMDCKVCHHKWDGAGPIVKCTNAGCHDDFKAKKGDRSAYNAFHDRKAEASCRGCHKNMKKGPTKCTECHPKDS